MLQRIVDKLIEKLRDYEDFRITLSKMNYEEILILKKSFIRILRTEIHATMEDDT